MSTQTALLPRLLRGVGELPMERLATHLDVHGPLPDLNRRAASDLIELIAASGLRGRGGAGFPVAMKMRAVAARRWQKVVLANGSEGEPASKKDRMLLRELPHLVLDGVSVAAAAVGAREAIVAVAADDDRGIRRLEQAIHDRARTRLATPRLSLLHVPPRYIAGQETALINLANTGAALPTFGERPFERGVRQRPTLVQNVETLAHLALIARHGSDWFRQIGSGEDPGSALVTLSGAVEAPGVYEIAHGTPLVDLLEAGIVEDRLRGVLVGGYFGTWITAAEHDRVLLDRESLSRLGASLGAGVVVALGQDSCPVAETLRVADYFAAEGAGQCGPCVNGLGAIADTLQRVGSGTAPPGAFADLQRWCSQLHRRGACAHPDGAARFVASALSAFGDEFETHARSGRCRQCVSAPILPTPHWQAGRLAA